MSIKRQVKYEELATNGGIDITLLESGDWHLETPDKLTARDVLVLRAMLSTLIEEQGMLKQ